MVYGYIRFSTVAQEETQQMFAINEYAEKSGLSVDKFVKDEGVSGGVSYRDRNLNGLVETLKTRAKKMKEKKIPVEKDVLIVTEVSRLGRAMADISRLLEELRAIGIRLVIIKMGVDYDCANLRATDQFLFQAMAFAGQVEKELIQSRTQSALDAKKEAIKRDGGFMSKNGNWIRKLGRPKGCDTSAASSISARNAKNRADAWKAKSPLYIEVKFMVQNRTPRNKILEKAAALYQIDPVMYGTREGSQLSPGILSRWIRDMKL